MILKRYKFIWFVLLSIFLTFAGCSPLVQEVKTSLGLNPEEGLETALSRTPSQWEGARKQAKAVDPKVTKGQKLLKDKALNRRVQSMVDRLQAVSHAPEIPFRVKIIDSEQINAFNTGGELLYVYKGLIDFVGSDDELAGILAHEMAHGIGAHLQREQRSMFLPSLGSVLTSAALGNKNADQVIGLVNQAVSSGYSRRHEREADILSVVYTNKAGFNPLSFEDFFNRINKKASEVKKEQEKGLRKEYRSYQIADQKEKQGKIDYERYSNLFQSNPSSSIRKELQRAKKRWQSARKTREKKFVNYQKAYQSYATAISQFFPIFQSHPSDPERIVIVSKTYQYLKGEISLQSTPSSVHYVMEVLKKLEKQIKKR